jgi:hypothetical protein
MAELIIKGDSKQLAIIIKTLRNRAAKYNLQISLNDDNKGVEIPPLVNDQSSMDEPKRRGRKQKDEE